MHRDACSDFFGFARGGAQTLSPGWLCEKVTYELIQGEAEEQFGI